MARTDSGTKHIFSPGDLPLALIGSLVALSLYLCTLAPSITGEDSGEFVTAACTLGIAHPPGYPLYCMLGWLFSQLPLASPAWRINLMSACFSAAAVGVLILTLLRLTRNRPVALLSGLMLACTRELWSQSVIAEVYTLSLFFLALAFLCLLLWAEEKRLGFLHLFAFFLGIGMTVHNTFMLVLPSAVVFLFLSEYKAEERTPLPVLCKAALCTALPLFLFLYLPLRSRVNPLLDWGNPETLPLLLRHILRSQYSFMVEQYPRSIPRFMGQLGVYLHFAREQAGLIPALTGLAGLLLLWRRRPPFALFLLLNLFLIPAGFAFWQNFEHTREWLWIMRVFAIPAWYLLALGSGIALDRLYKHLGKGRSLALLIALAFVLFPLITHYHYNDKSDYDWTEDYGRALLDLLEPDALFVSESDHASFSLLYFQAVTGERKDIDNIRRYGYLHSDLFKALPRELKEKVGPFPPRRYDNELIDWLVDHSDRPLYLAKIRPLKAQRFQRYEACGPVYRVLRLGEQWIPPQGLASSRINSNWDTRDDYTADAILYEQAFNRAQTLLLSIHQDETPPQTVINPARAWLEEALRHYGRDAAALNNVGTLLARYGFYSQAQGYFEEACTQLPHSAEINLNLQRIKERLEEE